MNGDLDVYRLLFVLVYVCGSKNCVYVLCACEIDFVFVCLSLQCTCCMNLTVDKVLYCVHDFYDWTSHCLFVF